MNVLVLAFGFKYGLPPALDLLFDVRFLRNPNYDPQLQPLTGTDPQVGNYIEADPSFTPFLQRLFGLLDFVLPRYGGNGKDEITIGIGCTGGRHRSVYVARRLVDHLNVNPNMTVASISRDVDKAA